MNAILAADRYHDISCGHRVVGHENKCAFLHGHNYRIFFGCTADALDKVGRVIDFSVMKAKLCMWLEDNWDHKFLAWEKDSVLRSIQRALDLNDQYVVDHVHGESAVVSGSIVWVPFNPTAENMAQYLLEVIGPQQLANTGVRLVRVKVEETRKCSAIACGDV